MLAFISGNLSFIDQRQAEEFQAVTILVMPASDTAPPRLRLVKRFVFAGSDEVACVG